MALWTVSVLLTMCITPSTHAADTTSSVANLRALLTDRFSSIRHHVTGPDAKQAAASYFYTTMKGYGMQVLMDRFLLSDKRVEASNILALWNGRLSNTPDDRPMLLAAHYDTRRDSPGVNDNGSGMAALMEAARVIASQPCMQEFTVGFVALDFWEREKRTLPGAACYEFGCGSRQWVTESLLPYLKHSGLSPSNFKGVVVLDGLLSYNNTPGSQRIRGEELLKQTPGAVEWYNTTAADGFRGNFITVVGRDDYDESLYEAFTSKWNGLGSPQYKINHALIPIKDVQRDGPKSIYWPVYRFVSYSDLWSFWKDNPDLKTMLLSDTAAVRGAMAKCYHRGCDDMRFVTDETLGFLKKSTDAVIALALDFSNTRMSCRDPIATAPADFKPGLAMETTLEIGGRPGTFVIFLDSFEASGAVHVTITKVGTNFKDPLAGRYDAETQELTLRLAEPLGFGGSDVDPFRKTNWVIHGRLTSTPTGPEFDGNILNFLGQGHRIPLTFSTPQAPTPQSGSPEGLPSLLGLVICVLLNALIMAAL